MLRRSILEISSRRPLGRIPTQITTQIPLYLSIRKEFSVASQPNPSNGSGSSGKSGSNSSKLVIGTIALGAAALTAYQSGYLDKFLTKEQKIDQDLNQDLHDAETVGEHAAVQEGQVSQISSPNVDNGDKKVDSDPYYDSKEGQIDNEVRVSESEPQKVISEQEAIVPSLHRSTDNAQEDLETKSQELNPSTEPQEAVQTSPTTKQDAPVIQENVLESEQPHHLGTTSMTKESLNDGIEEPKSLLDEYLLRKKAEETAPVSSDLDKDTAEWLKGTDEAYMSKDGKLVLDFLQAIHTAEKRQAELDAHIFSEEKRAMKEKYEKELKDARARELMYAERETILDKELHKEKLKAAAALKSLQEKLEEELRIEIEKKEAETEQELKRLQDLAKAELAAVIASEKASQIEKMAEANLNINALCMAFYARSEEARKSHSVHKLALGALALEDALSKGLPIQKEVDALKSYVDGIDKDSLLGLVMSSLPEDTLKNGTDTILQLHHKFDGLKGTLRHFSLMPQGGGGILAHSLARVASMLKVKEADQSGDGIESLINRVESLLADGKLVEAAETLENGLKGSQAAEVVGDWVQQARNRAITEQALTLLQSYATSVSLT